MAPKVITDVRFAELIDCEGIDEVLDRNIRPESDELNQLMEVALRAREVYYDVVSIIRDKTDLIER